MYGPPAKLARSSKRRAPAARTRRTGTSVSLLGVDGADGQVRRERRPANLEDVFVLLTGEEMPTVAVAATTRVKRLVGSSARQ